MNDFECKMHIVPDSDHNMHQDNPIALANTIINDLLKENLPVLTLLEYNDPNLKKDSQDWQDQYNDGLFENEEEKDNYEEDKD